MPSEAMVSIVWVGRAAVDGAAILVDMPPSEGQKSLASPSSPAVSTRMKAQRIHDTAPERALRSELHRIGLRFRLRRTIGSAVRARPDLVFPVERVAVFVDGCFWHCCPVHQSWPRANSGFWRAKLQGNAERDRRIDMALRDDRWLTIRVWEHEDPLKAASQVRSTVLAVRGTSK